MGATGWKYHVPYQPDVEQALQDLRAEVFRTGQYFKLHPNRQPATIEELVESNAEEGTHSILDIFRTGAWPDYMVAAPLSPDELRQHFGTTELTRDLVDRSVAGLDRIQSQRGGWVGTYVVTYENGAPAGIVFFGQSGD